MVAVAPPVERPSSGIFGEPVSACKQTLFERRSSLSRSCDTGDVDEEERHSQRGQQRLKYKMVWKRATWMQRSFTRNVPAVF